MLPMPKKAWQELPQGFLILALLAVMFCELAAFYIQLNPLALLWGLRLCEGALLYLLIRRFDVMKALGMVKPKLKDWQWLLWVAGILLFAGLILLLIFSDLHVWLKLPSFAQGISGIILMLLLAPVVEELFFRGVVYRLLRQAFGVWIAIVLSALCFASMHGAWLSPQLVGGLIFAIAYEYTRNLWVPILLHVMGNAFIILLVWLW